MQFRGYRIAINKRPADVLITSRPAIPAMQEEAATLIAGLVFAGE